MLPIGATSMSTKLALALTVAIALIVLMSSNQSLAAPQPSFGEIKFTRCDGSTEPIGVIEISACKDQKDFCLFKVGVNYTATIEFTSPKAYEHPRFWLDFEESSIGLDACKAAGIKCPLEAGVKQQMTDVINLDKNWYWSQRGKTAKLAMSDDRHPEDGRFYCVKFPAKLLAK